MQFLNNRSNIYITLIFFVHWREWDHVLPYIDHVTCNSCLVQIKGLAPQVRDFTEQLHDGLFPKKEAAIKKLDNLQWLVKKFILHILTDSFTQARPKKTLLWDIKHN